MNVLKVIFSLVWGLPQNVCGLFWLLYVKYFRKHDVEVTWDSLNCVISIRYLAWRVGGVSLGLFIFHPTPPDYYVYQHTVYLHEVGHSKQSLMLGPLYLFIIGIPSITWNKLKSEGYFKQKDYYSFYTEKWADDLMNIDPKMRRLYK